MKKILLAYRSYIWFFFLILSGILLIAAIQRKKRMQLDDVVITVRDCKDGNFFINEKDIRKILSKGLSREFSSMPISLVSMKHIESVLEKDPFIRNADVFVDALNRVNIRIDQKEPLFRVLDSSGRNYYVDEQGSKIPLSRHFTSRVIVCTGSIPAFREGFLESSCVLHDLYSLAGYLRQDPYLNALIEQVNVEPSGDYVLIPKFGDQEIVLGDMSSLEEKFRKLKVFYREGMREIGWNRYKSISLKYDKQVICQR